MDTQVRSRVMSKKKVGIIDYGAGNLGSIYNAIKYLDVQTKIIRKVCVTNMLVINQLHIDITLRCSPLSFNYLYLHLHLGIMMYMLANVCFCLTEILLLINSWE